MPTLFRHSILIALVLSILAVGPAAPASADDSQAAFIDVMHGYLGVAEQYTSLAARPEAAVYFAVEGIVEVYERRGELDKAIGDLEQLLEQHGDNQTVRNIVRFKLRDLKVKEPA